MENASCTLWLCSSELLSFECTSNSGAHRLGFTDHSNSRKTFKRTMMSVTEVMKDFIMYQHQKILKADIKYGKRLKKHIPKESSEIRETDRSAALSEKRSSTEHWA